jgi:SAM-dependent methyltransferase
VADREGAARARRRVSDEPSAHLLAELPRLRAARARGPIVELACGRGRNALAVAAAALPVVGIDRDPEALAGLRASARDRKLRVSALRADLETPHGIPLLAGSCGAILVFRFLFRPLAAAIEAALAPGGLLLYETFTLDQRSLGQGPRNPAFLLAPGELRALFSGLELLAYSESTVALPWPQALARLTARRPG